MKDSLSKMPFNLDEVLKRDTMGIPDSQIKAVLDQSQMQYLPFVYASFAVLFLAYAGVQAFILREQGADILVAVALASTAVLFILQRLLAGGRIPDSRSEWMTAVVAGLILISILLRLYLTADPGQSVNLALFLFGTGVLFLSARWYITMSAITFAGLGYAIFTLPYDDWDNLVVFTLAAVTTGFIAHVARVRAFRHAVILRIVERRQRQELQRRTRQLQTNMAVGQRITSILELEPLLGQIAELIWQKYNSYYIGVFLPAENRLTIKASAEAGRAVPPDGLHIKAGLRGHIGWVLANGAPLRFDDLNKDPRTLPAEKAPNAKSELVLPLKMGDKVLGVLDLQSDRLAAFAPDDVPVFQLLAGQIAIALENAQLYEEIKAFNQQLEGMVQERTKALQEAYGRLERLDKTKTDFITIASHELRTPLTIVNFNNQLLMEDEVIQGNSYYHKWTQGIHKGVSRMEEVVESMLDVAKIDSSALDLYPARLDVRFLIQQVGHRFQEALAGRDIQLQIAPMANLPEIEADAEALQKIFNHLIVNGIKYTPDGGSIQVDGRPLQHPINGDDPQEAIEITVADTGIGIAPEIQELIFEKFYQTGEVMLHSSGKTTFKGGGAGLGLAIARGIVEGHHGRIWVESAGHDEDEFPGSCFHIVLPVKQPVT